MAARIYQDVTVKPTMYDEPVTYQDAQVLGKGRYCVAYRLTDGRVLIRVAEGEYMKDLLRHTPANEHLPEIEHAGDGVGRNQYADYYIMPYYEKLTAAHKDAWRQYRLLAKFLDLARTEIMREYPKLMRGRGHYINQRLDDLITDMAGDELPERLKEAISDLVYQASNYGEDVTFEFAPRNLGVDSQGRLILRDVLFDASKLWKR